MKPLTRHELQREVAGLCEIVNGYLKVFAERADKPEYQPDCEALASALEASRIMSSLLKEAAELEIRSGRQLN